MKPLRVSLWLAAVAVAALAGCGGSPTAPTSAAVELPAYKAVEGKVRVVFVSNNPEEFWTIAEAGAKKAGADLKAEGHDVEVVFRRPDQGDAARQKQVIESELGRGAHAIAISVIDPKNQTPYLDEIAAKIPVLAVDNDAPASERLTYIGTNNYAAGRAAGKLVKKALPDGGTVAIFVGDLAPLNARQRRQGVIDELAGRGAPPDLNDFQDTRDGETVGKYKLHKRTYTDQPEGASRCKAHATNALTELQNEPNLCFVGLWAYNPPMILSAVKDFKDGALLGKVKIVGFDESTDTLKGVADDQIVGTIVQQPYQFGEQSIKKMAEVARKGRPKGPPEAPVYIPYRIITKEAGLKLDGETASEAVGPFQAELQQLLRGK
jgi:ribose transport system substrate-binding protein